MSFLCSKLNAGRERGEGSQASVRSGRQRENNKLTDEQGSIVVEAAIVLPLIMMLMLFFVILIRLCSLQLALHQTAVQAAKLSAAHMYPIALAWDQMSSKQGEQPAGELFEVQDNNVAGQLQETGISWAAEAASWLPAPAGELISQAIQGNGKPLQSLALTAVTRSILEPMIRDLAEDTILIPDRIRLQLLRFPDLDPAKDPLIGVSLTYEYPLKVPLIGKEIVLSAQAVERVWIGDALPARNQLGGEDGSQRLQIVAINPSPVKPGRPATVIVRTDPGAYVSLGVEYKSGSSKAKNLGLQQADDEGFVSWTWHVSGNTTPGTWLLHATGTRADGEVESDVEDHSNAYSSRHFIVAK